MEITHSGPICIKYFHEKTNKVKHCIDNKAYMVFVNGIKKIKEPKYLLIGHEKLAEYTKIAEKKYGIVSSHDSRGQLISKPQYRYDLSLFSDEDWRILPSIEGIQLPDKYKQIYDLL